MKHVIVGDQIALSSVLLVSADHAQTIIVASSGERADLQAAIDKLSGDGVVVSPVGKWELAPWPSKTA